MLEQALVRLDQAAQHLTVDADVLEKLKFPRETIQVRLMILYGRRIPQILHGVALPL